MPEARSRRSSTARDSSASAASILAATVGFGWGPKWARGETQREHQPDEPLLGAVMEVPLELLALTVGCGDEPSL